MQVSVRAMGAILFTVGLVGVGCAESRDASSTPAPDSSAVDSPGADPGTRERVTRVSMHVEVDRVAEAVIAMRDATERAGGYVESSAADDERADVELRVPSDAVREVEARIAELGHVTSTRQDVEDVTLAHADQAARLVSAHAEEARLVEMFATRTDDLADVLAVERELSRVREQIERLDAEERALRDRIAMAQISVEVARSTPAFTSEPSAFLASSITTGARVAGTLALATFGVIAALAPTALLTLTIAFVARALVRFLRARSMT